MRCGFAICFDVGVFFVGLFCLICCFDTDWFTAAFGVWWLFVICLVKWVVTVLNLVFGVTDDWFGLLLMLFGLRLVLLLGDLLFDFIGFVVLWDV